MTDAGGTNKVELISNAGAYSIYAVSNTEVSNGETVPIDGTNGLPGLAAEDHVILLGGIDQDNELCVGGGTLSAEYDETNMHFTVTNASATDAAHVLVFMHIPQRDPHFGSL